MFETVRGSSMSSRRIFIETLPLSIGAHAVVIIGLLVANVWTVKFPSHSPKMHQIYQMFSAPMPPPPPPPPAAAATAVKQVITQQAAAIRTPEDVAPTIIPDVIPLVAQQTSQVVVEQQTFEGVAGGIEGGVDSGVVGGMIGGVTQGQFGGTVGGVVGGVISDAPNTVIVARDARLPMTALSQVYPRYPEESRLRGHEDVVLVRYIVARDGRVREVIVLQGAERPVFTEAAVKAIRHWRFKPMIKDGQAQEVVHELTIYFRLA